jgi:hypothetical protein
MKTTLCILLLSASLAVAGLWKRGDDVRELPDGSPKWAAMGYAPVQVSQVVTATVTNDLIAFGDTSSQTNALTKINALNMTTLPNDPLTLNLAGATLSNMTSAGYVYGGIISNGIVQGKLLYVTTIGPNTTGNVVRIRRE